MHEVSIDTKIFIILYYRKYLMSDPGVFFIKIQIKIMSPICFIALRVLPQLAKVYSQGIGLSYTK